MQCAHCATPVPDDARFCQSCGSQVSDAEGQANATASMDGAAFAHLESMLREDTEGEFVVEKMLGRGGMAVVYLATEVHLHRKVALKVLPPELTFGHGVERFKREARTAAALDHPNIIPIYRVASGGKIFWYAMKYLEGRALDDILKERKQFSLDETVDILSQVGDALDYAHDHKVVHRDIKPANVMLDNRERVVVTDFGIAKALTEGTLTASGSVIGTPYYMSPEQGLGKPVTGAADQYSVAVMAYRMLAGSVPFEGDSAIDILHKHCTMAPPPLQTKRDDLPRHVYQAVHRALDKDPDRRFKNVTGFVKALTTPGAAGRVSQSDMATMVVSAQELSNVSGQISAPAVPRPKKRPAWLWAAAAVVVLGGGGFAVWQATSGNGAQAAEPIDPETTTEATTPPAIPTPTAPTTGWVDLAALPNGARVSANGTTQAGGFFELGPGSVGLAVEAPNYDRWTTTVNVVAGDTTPVRYAGRLTPQAPPRTQPARTEPARQTTPARAQPVVTHVLLKIGTRPVNATVLVNGQELPSARLRDHVVGAGEHLIRIIFGAGAQRDTTVVIEPGRTDTLTLVFSQGP